MAIAVKREVASDAAEPADSGGALGELSTPEGGAFGGAPTRTTQSEMAKPNVCEPMLQMPLAASNTALVLAPLGMWMAIYDECVASSGKTCGVVVSR